MRNLDGLEIYESQIPMRHVLSTTLWLIVAEKIAICFQRPIGQRCVSTPKKEKLSRIDSNRLQKSLGLGSTLN